MARQRCSEKTVNRLNDLWFWHGPLPSKIVKVLVRGGTNHRKDLFCEDGSRWYLWPWGELDNATELDSKPIPVKDPTIPEECRQ